MFDLVSAASSGHAKYGEITSQTDWACRFLEVEHEIIPGVPVHRCGRYEWIMKNVPEASWRAHPAFEGGCSSTLFNTARDRVIAAMLETKAPS